MDLQDVRARLAVDAHRFTLPMGRRAVWVAISVFALGCPSSNPASASLEAQVASAPSLVKLDKQRYAGTYVYVGTNSERAAVDAAADVATHGVTGANVVGVELMKKRQEIRPSYTISFDEQGNVRIETPGYPPEVSPLDGTEVKLTDKYGAVVEDSHRFVDRTLVQQGRTNEESGATQFKLQNDGNTLRVTRVTKSSKLPRPVEFTLTYVRRHGP